jgi:hypothetical protein
MYFLYLGTADLFPDANISVSDPATSLFAGMREEAVKTNKVVGSLKHFAPLVMK